jgi:hypothetical protein
LSKYGIEPGEGTVEFSGGYFQVPDLVFDLPLAANEKLVLIYFMRRADRAGRSFPSVERICRDCGFGSKNTALKVINSLVNRGLIRRRPVPGRSHDYFVSRELCRVIEDAKARYRKSEIASPAARNDEIDEPTNSLSLRRSVVCDCGNLMKENDGFGSPFFLSADEEGRVNESSPTRSEYEHPCSDNEPPGVQNMNPKEYTVEPGTENEYTVKKEARKKKVLALEEAHASSSLSPPLDDYDDNGVTLLDVAEHLHSLTPRERKEFDREALKFGKPGEPDPAESLWQRRLLRVRYLRQLRERGG